MTTQPVTRPRSGSERTDTRWHSVYIYFYEPDKDTLILDVVRPLLRSLDCAVQDAYLARHWLRGPHLRVHIRTDDHTWATTVQPAVDQAIWAYLEQHPSTAELDQDTELPMHLLLAQREQENGPLTPWLADNSVHYPPYDHRIHVLGCQEVADLVADYAAAGTELLFDMLHHARLGNDTKDLLGFGMLIAISHSAAPPLRRSFVAYRAHAEGLTFRTKDPVATKAAFDRQYAAERHLLVERFHRTVDTLEGGSSSPVPFVREWAALALAYADKADSLIERGLLFPKTRGLGPDDPEQPEFNHLMLNSQAFREKVFDAPFFQRYRFVLNCTYLQLSRLGFASRDRMRLCHLTANTVEDVYNVSAIDLVRQYVETNPNRP